MRLAMLRASVQGHPELMIDTCEMMRQGISYTVDTLQTISRSKDIEGKPGLVIGDDLASDFMESWKDPDQILSMADLIIAHRLHAQESQLAFPHRNLNNAIISISSTLIR
jgi:nicotinate-nucleotide adenylyltransferase